MSKDLDELMAQAAAEGAEIGDDEVDIDLSEAATFEAFTDTVPVEIVGVTLKRAGKDAKVPGAPYLELKLRVFEGEYEKRILWTNINLTGTGAGFGFDKLSAFGAVDKAGEPVTKENPKVSIKQLQGLKANAACAPDKREEYKHKVVVNKITAYVSEAAKEAANLK